MKENIKHVLINSITLIMLGVIIISSISSKTLFAEAVNKTVTLSKGKVNNLNVGDVGTVSLQSNPTTGYDWYVTCSKTGVLNLVSNNFKASKSKIVGSKGTRNFTFKAVGSGSCTLTFKYYRSFEGAKAATKTITYNITVSSPKQAIITLAEDKTNTINALDLAQVSLESNPTTGYNWYESYSNKGILSLVSNDYVLDSKLVGSGGKQTFIFKGLAKGDCTITLKYYRSWEGEKSAIKTAVYNVKVK